MREDYVAIKVKPHLINGAGRGDCIFFFLFTEHHKQEGMVKVPAPQDAYSTDNNCSVYLLRKVKKSCHDFKKFDRNVESFLLYSLYET